MTILLSNQMRAHFTNVAMLARNNNVFIDDRLTNQHVDLISGLMLISHDAAAVACYSLSFQMHGGFGLLEPAGSFFYFGDAVLWLDFVAALFAEDAAFC